MLAQPLSLKHAAITCAHRNFWSCGILQVQYGSPSLTVTVQVYPSLVDASHST